MFLSIRFMSAIFAFVLFYKFAAKIMYLYDKRINLSQTVFT